MTDYESSTDLPFQPAPDLETAIRTTWANHDYDLIESLRHLRFPKNDRDEGAI